MLFVVLIVLENPKPTPEPNYDAYNEFSEEEEEERRTQFANPSTIVVFVPYPN